MSVRFNFNPHEEAEAYRHLLESRPQRPYSAIEYVAGCLATEARVTPEMEARFRNLYLMTDLHRAFREIEDSSDALDRMKKHLFYGKEMPELPGLESNPKSQLAPELATRISDSIRLLHATIGLVTEVGEIVTAVADYVFQYSDETKNLDAINLIEESGDVFWYLAILADVLGVTFQDIQDRNSRKLAARFPDKFKQMDALTRDLAKERAALARPAAMVASKIAEWAQTAAPGTILNDIWAQTANGSDVNLREVDKNDGFLRGDLYKANSSEPECPCIWGSDDGQILSEGFAIGFNLKLNTFRVGR